MDPSVDHSDANGPEDLSVAELKQLKDAGIEPAFALSGHGQTFVMGTDGVCYIFDPKDIRLPAALDPIDFDRERNRRVRGRLYAHGAPA